MASDAIRTDASRKYEPVIFAVGTWLAEDVNEHVEGSIGWPWLIAIVVAVLLLFIWPRLFRDR